MGTFFQLLLNPTIISLFFGFFFGIVTNYVFPILLMDVVSYYLIFVIGFKGGACLGVVDQCSSYLIKLTILGLLIGFLQPFLNYLILKITTSLDKINSVVVAAQYGSISIVTFITAVNFLTERGIPYDSFMSAVAGMMEIPALFSGLLILTKKESLGKNFFRSTLNILKSIFGCKKISIIFVGFLVGIIFRRLEFFSLDSLIVWPFNYILILFMFDIGIKIAKQRSSIKKIKPSLIAFSIYMPVIGGTLATLVASYMISEIGTIVLFALLIASASYIAVPAVMRTKLKESNEAIYMPLALGLTLPFNILIGIPYFYKLASFLV